MKKKRELLIQERVEALAIMVLTRRKDITINHEASDNGIDLIVRLSSKPETGLRQFGVQLQGQWASVDKQGVDLSLSRFVRKQATYAPFPFPACAFFFTMEKTEGWAAWVIEPHVRKGEPLLVRQLHPDSEPLNDECIERLVRQVNAWYDALFARLVAS